MARGALVTCAAFNAQLGDRKHFGTWTNVEILYTWRFIHGPRCHTQPYREYQQARPERSPLAVNARRTNAPSTRAPTSAHKALCQLAQSKQRTSWMHRRTPFSCHANMTIIKKTSAGAWAGRMNLPSETIYIIVEDVGVQRCCLGKKAPSAHVSKRATRRAVANLCSTAGARERWSYSGWRGILRVGTLAGPRRRAGHAGGVRRVPPKVYLLRGAQKDAAQGVDITACGELMLGTCMVYTKIALYQAW